MVQTGGLRRIGQFGYFLKTCFLAISDHSERLSKLGLGWVKADQVGWADGSFFKNLFSRHFRPFWAFKKRVGAGQGGPRWVQVGQDDDLVGG